MPLEARTCSVKAKKVLSRLETTFTNYFSTSHFSKALSIASLLLQKAIWRCKATSREQDFWNSSKTYLFVLVLCFFEQRLKLGFFKLYSTR